MSREALGFFWAVAVHAGRAMTFRADGAGLPKKPGGAFAAIFMIAMLMAILRHAVATGSMHPVGAGMGFMITIMLLAMMLGEKRFQCLGMYLCLSAGIDLVAIVTSGLGGLDVGGWPTLLWEGAGLVYGCYRFDRRGDEASVIGKGRGG